MRFNEDRMIWARVDKLSSPLGCWLWTGYIDRDGYGRARVTHLGEELAHRVVYAFVNGPVPDGLTLDHACRVRRCVNPAHLEPVTRGVNTLRGIGPTAVHARATHCISGHLFDERNTARIRTRCGTGRRCRACGRESTRRYQLRVAARQEVLR